MDRLFTRMRTKFLLITLPFLFIPVIVVAAAFQPDDILLGQGDGIIRQYRNGNQIDYLDTKAGTGFIVKGLCFSTDSKFLFAASFSGLSGGRISRFNSQGRLFNGVWAPAFPTAPAEVPASCVADAFGNVYIGTDKGIRKYRYDGSFEAFFQPEANHLFAGIDLGPDQCTLMYPSAGKVKRFDVCNNRPMADFADFADLSVGTGLTCSAVRIRRNGEVMVACTGFFFRLASDGRIIRGYEASYCYLDHPSWFVEPHWVGVSFAPDGTSFWASFPQQDSRYGRMCKLDIETGHFVTMFDDFVPHGAVVYGERTAATTECSDGIDNDGDGLIDYPEDPQCHSATGNHEAICFTIASRTFCLYRWLNYCLTVAVSGRPAHR